MRETACPLLGPDAFRKRLRSGGAQPDLQITHKSWCPGDRKVLPGKTENRRATDDRYVDALAIEDFSVHGNTCKAPVKHLERSQAALHRDGAMIRSGDIAVASLVERRSSRGRRFLHQHFHTALS